MSIRVVLIAIDLNWERVDERVVEEGEWQGGRGEEEESKREQLFHHPQRAMFYSFAALPVESSRVWRGNHQAKSTGGMLQPSEGGEGEREQEEGEYEKVFRINRNF